MHVEFLVEELSSQVALERILPKILGAEVTFNIRVFQGKRHLLSKLPGRLQGYKSRLDYDDDLRIVVLIDRDNEHCIELKQKLEQIASDAGLLTKTAAKIPQDFQVLNRLAIEELEAWFFGDVEAIRAAYPRISPNLGDREKFRDPDGISGGTWEALERELQKKGYHKGGLNKLAAARDIAEHLEPQRNRSQSFQVFRDGLLQMIKPPLTPNGLAEKS